MAITDSNEERIVSTGETNADTEIEYTLRPKNSFRIYRANKSKREP